MWNIRTKDHKPPVFNWFYSVRSNFSGHLKWGNGQMVMERGSGQRQGVGRPCSSAWTDREGPAGVRESSGNPCFSLFDCCKIYMT